MFTRDRGCLALSDREGNPGVERLLIPLGGGGSVGMSTCTLFRRASLTDALQKWKLDCEVSINKGGCEVIPPILLVYRKCVVGGGAHCILRHQSDKVLKDQKTGNKN